MDTVEVYARAGLWYWQRYSPDSDRLGQTQGPFGTELDARRNARRVNIDRNVVVMLPASAP